ncbi:uncharacterized protein LOC119736842 [Patiria miniata]|uniref:Peroxidase n=1 Tax=Patiria miniata TaxID=46514 RepID=A0A914ARU9_PATMI|nr:uncharacterized protein LOC119736842 [Patiria miniata]
MSKLLLLVLLASVASCILLDEDIKSLEDLEDLLLRDENKREYSDKTEGRTPFGLWTQFNSARGSPTNRRRLQRFLRMLQKKRGPFSRMLSAEDIQRRISQIRTILGRTEACVTTAAYRTLDGTCNNIAQVDQGSIDTTLTRVTPIAYEDGFSEPRTQSVVDGEALPSARDVSRAVFDNGQAVIRELTALTMHFGQLTDHDLTAVHSQSGVDCSDCSVEGECFSIPIDASDPVFGGVQSCFQFVRSSFETDSAGVRQHVNSITTYLDASFVYGSDDATASELADDAGFMEHQTDSVTGRELLPPDEDLAGCAGVDASAGIYCGKAGDGRAAEQPGLTSLHTLFLREHNRIAAQLLNLDPSLSAYDVYQKARRIVGAEWQHIMYNEHLPLIIGEKLYRSAGLSPDAPYAYDPAVDATISNVFAAAAYRFGHTLVPFDITRATSNYKPTITKIKLSEAFFNATYMYDESIPDGAVDSILRGMTIQNSQVVDGHFSDALMDNLFGDPDVVGDGFDLTALNIQRARDHGIPSYTTIRTDFCGFDDVTSFKELADQDIMRRPDVQNLRDIYGDVRDIDAFVGLVLEKTLTNTLVGPTLACIFADQFHRLKFGDRFFYLNSDQFTTAEINEIKKATMARLLCDNVEGVRRIQPYTFIQAQNFQSLADKGYDSFYEYSRSSTWPHQRATVLDGLDNRRATCTKAAGKIPFVDISQFIYFWLLLLAIIPSIEMDILSEDLGELEELEDLLLSEDKIKAYSDPHKGRDADALLRQFNSAKQSPEARGKLRGFKTELQKDGNLFSKVLSQDETEAHLTSIDNVLNSCTPATSPEYRRMDGTCNNLAKPEQGAAESPIIRVVRNAYEDGLSAPRTLSVTGRPLPSAREISRRVFDNNTDMEDGQSYDYTSLGIHIGQLTDHDITAVHGTNVDCPDCSVEGECFSILIDESDPVFGGVQPCLTFRRSAHFNDTSGVRQHTNSITAYMDASFVYGSDDVTADDLADADGSLRHLTDHVTYRDLLPPDEHLAQCAGVNESSNIFCCKAGDSRAAEQPGLTALHTLFMREHNRIAAELRVVRPSLTPVEVYQSARKIVIAEWQHISFNEYVPQIVGDELYNAKKLSPTAPYAYDPDVDASIANVFAAAAFRFGHTEIPDYIIRATKNFRLNLPIIWMREAFFNASYMFDERICDGAVDSILRGMAVQDLPLVDGHLTSAITDNLFGDPDVKGDGFDLASLNIQRGRDHGLPSYTTIRTKLCGFDDVTSYSDLRGIISNSNLDKLISVYGNDGVKDVDAFVGFILEEHLPNALVGPTLACIFADQFHRLKFGDRFFYQNPDHFTQAQMDEIAKASMARLMCDNVEAVTNIQPFVLIASKNYQTTGDDETQNGERRKRSFNSFYEYSRSGTWPHQRPTILDGLDNSRVNCTLTDQIPVVDITQFI